MARLSIIITTSYGHFLPLALFVAMTPLTVMAQSCPGGSCPQSTGCAGFGYEELDFCAYPNGGCSDADFAITTWVGSTCCAPASPIIIDVLGNGFKLTDPSDGVWFDFYGTGNKIRIAWTRANSDDAWLVLDRDGNGTIDSGKEMFGNITQQSPSSAPNGFKALAEFDKRENGGNEDGVIDARDGVFNRLRLWQDRNHDGISQTSELSPLTLLGVTSINLSYERSGWVDAFGNRFRYRSTVGSAHRAHVGRYAYDVFLATEKNPATATISTLPAGPEPKTNSAPSLCGWAFPTVRIRLDLLLLV
jgi:hypothetical protein